MTRTEERFKVRQKRSCHLVLRSRRIARMLILGVVNLRWAPCPGTRWCSYIPAPVVVMFLRWYEPTLLEVMDAVPVTLQLSMSAFHYGSVLSLRLESEASKPVVLKLVMICTLG